MPIRLATLNDLPMLLEGAVRMHALTRFKDQPFQPQLVEKAFTDLICSTTGKYVFLVAQDSKDQIVGALIGLIEQQIFSDLITASVMHYDVLPEARAGGWGVRLLKAFEGWANNRKVFEICVGVNSGLSDQKVGRFLEKMGYQFIGGNYAK